MFSSAIKSFSSNIQSNYSISQTPSTVAGPWKIYDAKKRSGGKEVSVFVFDRKALDPSGGGSGLGGNRSGAASLKRAHDEVVDRLKKEASSLARLRHPSILELTEPVEETRNGGLMFATEPVQASLASVLEEKNEQEGRGGVGGRGSRYIAEDADGRRRRREVEIDELEIQKGLLQIGKGLEFLHESAGLVHANLNPDSIFVNAKSDWKISGLGFSSPPEGVSNPSVSPISLSELLNHDPRLPRSVQLNLDFTSPDFVLDTNLTTMADMFSLGLIIIALYNSPHKSPLDTGFSVSSYKRIFASPSSIPQQNNNFLASHSLPKEMASSILPRLITRRPAQRFDARSFQQAAYFDNILVSTIRFLESLPAKSPNEKSQFMRGLPRILSQFPKSVLEKKVLPALLEETKDHDLLSLILQNVFKVLELVPNSRRAFSERVIPKLREVFLPEVKKKSKEKETTQEKDVSKEGGLVVLLENMQVVASNCSGKEFKDCILPIIHVGLDSPTHSVQDKALQTTSVILSVLDFSSIKNDYFPTVAQVFIKTSSMAIKIQGLEAFNLLCGGTSEKPSSGAPDDLSGLTEPQAKLAPSNNAALDKFTIQEKIIPLLRAIKTKEPAVMMAALRVFRQVGKVADLETIAFEVLPTLWQFSLGPLLNLEQFQAFIALIRSLSNKIEKEQTKKLQELSSTGGGRGSSTSGARSPGVNGFGTVANGCEDGDFESLVSGRKAASPSDMFDSGWGTSEPPSSTVRPPNPRTQSRQSPTLNAPQFSWSTPAPPVERPKPMSLAQPQTNPGSRSITPDLSAWTTLSPSNTLSPNPTQPQTFSQPMQPYSQFSPPPPPASTAFNTLNTQQSSSSASISWSSAGRSATSTIAPNPGWASASPQTSNPWSSNTSTASSGTGSWSTMQPVTSGNKPPLSFGQTASPPLQPNLSAGWNSYGIKPPPPSSALQNAPGNSFGSLNQTLNQRQHPPAPQQQSQNPASKSGLDKYESLL